MKITCAHGTAKQFEEAVQNRINQLGGQVDEINSATNADDNERYIHTLIGDIDTAIGDIVDSVTFDTDENNLIVTTAVDENVHEYSIPLADLTMDFKSIDRDVNYVCNYIKRDTNACANIEGAEDFGGIDEDINRDSSYKYAKSLIEDIDKFLREIEENGIRKRYFTSDDLDALRKGRDAIVDFTEVYTSDIKESGKNEFLGGSARFSRVTGSADYYDYPKYSKTLYLPSIRQGKVKLTIGTFSDQYYDDEHMFEILAIVDVEARRDEFTLDSEKLYKKLDIRDGHEKLSGYDDRYDDFNGTVDEIYDYFMTLDQDDIDDTLIELADDFDADRVNQMFGPMTTFIKAGVDFDNGYMDQLISEVERYAGNHISNLKISIRDNTFMISGYDENGEKVDVQIGLRELSLNSIEDDYDTICSRIEKVISKNFPKYEIEDYDWDKINQLDADRIDKIADAVARKLESVGVDMDTQEAQYYTDGAVDLILQDDDHDVETWWKETLANYKDELDELPHVAGNV